MQVNGLVHSRREFRWIGNMKTFAPKMAIDILGISKPTLIKWVRTGVINVIRSPAIGARNYWISENEIKRVKKLMKTTWISGQSKFR